MDNTYWILAVTVFLSFLSLVKYTNKEQLRDWIEDYVDRVLPREVEQAEQSEEEVVELEEVQDMIYDFVIRNKEIFSKIKVKDGCETSEGHSKES